MDAATPAIESVGFIGLGVMGKPMARNLMKAGFKLAVKGRRPGPAEELAAEGARRVASPREAAASSDVVITMLPNSPDVREVCLGPAGIIEAVKDRAEAGRAARLIVIDMSTISPKASQEIGAALGAAGIDYLEAPVSGGDIGAIKGTLAIMAGGPEPVFERARPMFHVLGKSAVLVGGWGAGQTTKLANNLLAAITIQGVAEALVFASKGGVDPMKMYEAIKGGAAACWSLDFKTPKIVDRDFKPGFMCKLHLKDLNLALDAAREMDLPIPATEQVRSFYERLVASGAGEDDNCSLVRLVEQAAHHEVAPRADG